LLLILFAPFCYRAEGKFGQQLKIEAKANWFFYLLRIRYKDEALSAKVGPFSINLDAIEKKKIKKRKKPSEKESFSLSSLPKLLTNVNINSIISLGIMFFKRLWRCVRPSYFRLNAVFGLGDPFKTAMYMGVYEALAGVYGFRTNLALVGDFSQKQFAGDFKLSGYFTLAALLRHFIWLLLQKPLWNIIKNLKGQIK